MKLIWLENNFSEWSWEHWMKRVALQIWKAKEENIMNESRKSYPEQRQIEFLLMFHLFHQGSCWGGGRLLWWRQTRRRRRWTPTHWTWKRRRRGTLVFGLRLAIYPFSRRGALKLITPLQLLFRQCKRSPPSFSEVDFTLMLMVIDLIKSNHF